MPIAAEYIPDWGGARVVGCDEEHIIIAFRFVRQRGFKAVLSILARDFVQISFCDVFWISPFQVVVSEP